jgi:hypothetical protein
MKLTQSQKLLNALRIKVKKSSVKKVADELGYKSHATLVNWFNKNMIPEHRLSDVQKLIGGKK